MIIDQKRDDFSDDILIKPPFDGNLLGQISHVNGRECCHLCAEMGNRIREEKESTSQHLGSFLP